MEIRIKGASENNLKDIDLVLPKNKLIVFTGVSGSGKSTLALDTLQRECQRLYMESLGMTMNIGNKPKVRAIEGLMPAISITQHQSNNNPRSMVGTITEIASYLRVIFSKLGIQTEGSCDSSVPVLTANHFSFNKPEGACPACKGLGVRNLPDISKLVDSSKSIKEIAVYGWDQMYVERYGGSMVKAAEHYGFTMDMETPIKNYNQVQMDLLLYGVLSKEFSLHFPDIAPPKTVPAGRFEGVVTNIVRRYEQGGKQKLEKFFTTCECDVCHGVRFKDTVLQIKVGNENIRDVLGKSIYETKEWLEHLQHIKGENYSIVEQVICDTLQKVDRLINVGAGYLTLNQPAGSLSSGEWQRIKLASVIGSGLTGVLYVLDEPTAGLHARDIQRVVGVLKQLRDMGNTVLVIEHNLEIIKASDHIVDFGPGAGKYGGRIVASGCLQDVCNTENSLTGAYLSLDSCSLRKEQEYLAPRNFLTVNQANYFNLTNLSVSIPLERFVTVTGVSGSGKTNLVFGVIADHVERYFSGKSIPADCELTGLEHFDSMVTIDQKSIGRSSRSNPATYTEIFSDIRDLFAGNAKKEKVQLKPKDFSTNVVGGRCEECQGTGSLAIQMHFLPDVYVICPVCAGKRYQPSVMAITYKDYTISDVLDMSVDEGVELFETEKNLLSKLKVLQDVGLGYLSLGQPTSTLSGGEAQRLKLAKELMKPHSGRKLYLFDEPSTGLHLHDIHKMIDVFTRLVSQGNSVVVIEHNPYIIMASDYVIDLGPDGGKAGGQIIAQGTPLEIMKSRESATGRALAQRMSK